MYEGILQRDTLFISIVQIMKKSIVYVTVLLMMLFGVRASAQLSINAAYIHQEHTFNYQNGAFDSLVENLDYMNGGMLGVSLNVTLLGDIGLAPGAYISFAKAKSLLSDTTWGDGSISARSYTTSNFNIKFPFYLNFKVSLSDHANLIIFGGPVFNVGLSKLSDFKNVADQVDLHCDMGGTIGVGLQVSIVRIYLGYNVEMIDRDDFSLANKQSVKKAWEGSTLFAGVGISLGK